MHRSNPCAALVRSTFDVCAKTVRGQFSQKCVCTVPRRPYDLNLSLSPTSSRWLVIAWKTTKIRGKKLMSHLTLKLLSQRMAKTCLKILVSSLLLVHFPLLCRILFFSCPHIKKKKKRTGRDYLAIFCQRMQPQNNFRRLPAHCLRNEFPWCANKMWKKKKKIQSEKAEVKKKAKMWNFSCVRRNAKAILNNLPEFSSLNENQSWEIDGCERYCSMAKTFPIHFGAAALVDHRCHRRRCRERNEIDGTTRHNGIHFKLVFNYSILQLSHPVAGTSTIRTAQS